MPKKDLKKRLTTLSQEAADILYAYFWEYYPEDSDAGDIPKPKKSSPSTKQRYHVWFASTSALLKGFSPDRHSDFIDHYYINKKRKEILYDTYKIEDWMINLVISRGGSRLFEPDNVFKTRFEQQIMILMSAIDSFDDISESIRDVLQADLFDNELSAAEDLFSKGHFRAAGVLSGVVLEGHLKTVCTRHEIKLKKKATIANLNDALKKEEVIELPDWRRIQLLGDIRNLCGHKKKKDPTEDDIETMLSGTKKIISTVF